MSYAYVHKSQAQHTIFYRFTCEQCGTVTQWYPIEIQRESVVTTHDGYHDSAKTSAEYGAKAAVIRRMEQLHKDVAEGHYLVRRTLGKDEGITSTGDTEGLFHHYACPNCKAIQSWIVPSLKKEGGLGMILLIGLGLPILWGVALAIAKEGSAFLSLGAWHLLILFGLLIVGCFIGNFIYSARLRRKLRAQTGTRKNTPEINWCGM